MPEQSNDYRVVVFGAGKSIFLWYYYDSYLPRRRCEKLRAFAVVNEKLKIYAAKPRKSKQTTMGKAMAQNTGVRTMKQDK